MAPGVIEAQSPAEVREWLEAWRERERRLDLRAGLVCSSIVNAAGGRKGGFAAGPWDFFASCDTLRPIPTQAEIDARILRV